MNNRFADNQIEILKRAMDCSPVSMVVTGRNGNIEYVNQKFSELTGYSLEDVLGKNPRILKSEFNNPEYHQQLWDAILAGTQWHGEFCNRKKNGELFWVAASIAPVYDSQGTITHFVAFEEDITANKRATEAVNQNELLLNRSQEVAGIGSFVWDIRDDTLLWSPNMYAIYGLDAADSIGTVRRVIADLIHPDDRDRVREEITKMVEENVTRQLEFRIIRPDGAERILQSHSEFEFDSNGKAVQCFGISRDVTERWSIEQALRESEERFRKLFNNSIEAVAVHEIVLDEGGEPIDYVFLMANPAFESNTGWKVADIIGKRVRQVHPDIAKSNLIQTYGKVALTGEPTSFEAYVESMRRHYKITVYQVSKGRFATVFEDITERKEAEVAIMISEQRYRKLFSEMMSGSALHQILCDAHGNPVDYITIEANAAYETTTGLKREAILNKKVSEILPQSEFVHWLAIFGAVALGGKSTHYVIYSQHFDRHFEGIAYSPEYGQFAVVFNDVTERIKTQEALNDSFEQLHALGERLEHLREEERKSISREVHDELGQLLTALRMDVMKMKKSAKVIGHELEAKVESVLGLTDRAIKSVQEISARLRPGVLDDLGLMAAIEWQAEEFQKRSGIPCEVKLPEHEIAIDTELSTAMFRILQEGLTNVARHANATTVRVSLTDGDNMMVLAIVDDGTGIPEEKIHDSHSMGLLGIRERVRPFNGICRIRGVANKGTELRIEIPKMN